MPLSKESIQQLIDNGHLPYPVAKGKKIPAFAKGERAKYIPEYQTKAFEKVFHGIGVFPQNGVNWIDYDLTLQALIEKGFSEEVAQEIFNRVEPLAEKILPLALVARRGSKGFAAAFSGDLTKKTDIKIQSPTGESITVIDLIAGHGVGVVLPPTIHPDTKKPYYWLTERTLYDTKSNDLTPYPSELVSQIRSICSEYDSRKEVKREIKTKKGKSYGLVSHDFGSLPLDTLITLDRGVQVPLKEAIDSYQGEYCADPFEPHKGTQKAHVNHWGIFSHSNGGKKYFPERIELKDQDITSKIKGIKGLPSKIKEANKYRGEELAKWAYAIGASVHHRLGLDLPPPGQWLENFPGLNGRDFKRIKSHLDWLVARRIKTALEPLELTPDKYNHIHLNKDDNGLFDYTPVLDSKHKAVFLALGHGSGKTQVFGKGFFDGCNSGLATAHLESLTHQLREKLGGDHYQDSQTVRFNRIITTCINSLSKDSITRSTNNVDKVLFDEASQVRQALAEGKFNSEEIRSNVFERMKKILSNSDNSAFLDADITDTDIEFYCSMMGIDPSEVLLVTGDDKVSDHKVDLVYTSSGKGLDGLTDDIIACLRSGGRPIIYCEGEGKARGLHKRLIELFPNKKDRIKLFSGKLDSAKSEGLVNDPSGYTKNLDCLIHTSKLGSGFSIEHDTPHFTQGFCIFSGTCLTAQQAIQGMKRVRYIRYWKAIVLINNRLTYTKPRESNLTGLYGLKDNVISEKGHSKAYFATAYKGQLEKRGYEVRILNDWTSYDLKTKEITQQDIQETTEAKVISEPHIKPQNNQQWYENYAHHCYKLFGVVNETTATAYLKDLRTVTTYALLSGNDTTEETQTELIRPAKAVFKAMLKEKLSNEDCQKIMKEIKDHENEFRLMKLIPDRWLGQGIPDNYEKGNVAKLANSWGLTAKATKEGVKIEISDTMRLIYSPVLEGEASLLQLVLKLRDQGLSYPKIGIKLGISEDKVKRLVKKSRAKTPEIVINKYLFNDCGGKCPGNNDQSLTTSSEVLEQEEPPMIDQAKETTNIEERFGLELLRCPLIRGEILRAIDYESGQDTLVPYPNGTFLDDTIPIFNQPDRIECLAC